MEALIQRLPKAELHLHIEGTLEPELMFALAKRNQLSLPFQSIEEVKNAYQFTNLQSFLDIYYQSASVLLKEEDFYELMMAYFQRAQADNVKHAEIFFDAQTHTSRGIEFNIFMQGFHRAQEDAQKKWGISSHLIMCFLRDLSEASALETLEKALPYRKWIIGVGLDSAEMDHPPKKFENIFKKARDYGFLTVAHAGEEGPADYITQALDLLNVSRIDHGVRAIEDEKLMQRLAKEKIPLTVCPLSNIKLCIYPEMKKHSFKQLLDAGICVTVNSDDPAYFAGYIVSNYLALQKAFDFDAKTLIQIAKNSFLASFISEVEKQKYIQEIEAINLHA